jgi:hypothetical protein
MLVEAKDLSLTTHDTISLIRKTQTHKNQQTFSSTRAKQTMKKETAQQLDMKP